MIIVAISSQNDYEKLATGGRIRLTKMIASLIPQSVMLEWWTKLASVMPVDEFLEVVGNRYKMTILDLEFEIGKLNIFSTFVKTESMHVILIIMHLV